MNSQASKIFVVSIMKLVSRGTGLEEVIYIYMYQHRFSFCRGPSVSNLFVQFFVLEPYVK